MVHVVQRLSYLLSETALQQRAECEGIEVVAPSCWSDPWLLLSGGLTYPGLLDYGPLVGFRRGSDAPDALMDEAYRRFQRRQYHWGVSRQGVRFVHRRSGRALAAPQAARVTQTLASSATAQARHRWREEVWDAFRRTHPVLIATLTDPRPDDAAHVPIKVLPLNIRGRIALADAPEALRRYTKGQHLGVEPIPGTGDRYRVVSGHRFLTTIGHLLGPGLRDVRMAGHIGLVFRAPTHSLLWEDAATYFQHLASGLRVHVVPDVEYPEVVLRHLWKRDHVAVTVISDHHYVLRAPGPRPQVWWHAHRSLIAAVAEHYHIHIVPDWAMAPV